MPVEIGREMAALGKMSVQRLRERYAEAFGEPTTGNNKSWLVRRIAWRLQERAEGGLDERARRRAAELSRDAGLRHVPPRPRARATAIIETEPVAVNDPRLPAPGTILTRPYKGETLEVKVLADGFEFRGERFASLSAVAKSATGSHCNGFAFFGLARKESK